MSGNLAAVRTGFPVILTLLQDRNHLWGETSSVVAIRGEQPSGPAANKSSDLLKRGDQLPALLCLYHAEHHKRAFGGPGKWLPVTSSKSDFSLRVKWCAWRNVTVYFSQNHSGPHRFPKKFFDCGKFCAVLPFHEFLTCIQSFVKAAPRRSGFVGCSRMCGPWSCGSFVGVPHKPRNFRLLPPHFLKANCRLFPATLATPILIWKHDSLPIKRWTKGMPFQNH